MAEQGFQEFAKEAKEAEMKACTYERSAALLSVVGTVISLRDQLYTNCAGTAHPGGETRLRAIDIGKGGKQGKPASLADLFPEPALLDALHRDPILAEALGDKPANLKELREQIGDQELEVPRNPCKFQLPADFLSQFAFHHLEGERVAVRVALAPVGGACRAATAQLGLLLPVPVAFSGALQAAAQGKEGFLMGKRPGNTRTTTVRFRTR